MTVDLAGTRPLDSLAGSDRGSPPWAVDRSFARVLGEGDGAFAPARDRTVSAAQPAGRPPAGGLAPALARMADGQRAVDSLIAAAARGRTFTPAQLLALQAAVSRGAQAIEVVSRAADRLVGTMKQALGTQL